MANKTSKITGGPLGRRPETKGEYEAVRKHGKKLKKLLAKSNMNKKRKKK